MRLNTLKPTAGSKHPKRRVGRGIGSGLGKTAGGQMPLQRRLPKRGFISLTRNDIAQVRLADLNEVRGDVIDMLALKEAGLASSLAKTAKVFLKGEIKRAVKLQGLGVTKGARAAIEAAGGSIAE